MTKNKFIFLAFVFLLCLFPVIANAETVSFNVCISDSGAYSVTYDTTVATEVTKENITNQDVLNGHVPYPESVVEADKVKYNFTANRYSNTCIVNSNGEVETCPSAAQASSYPIYEKYGQNQDDYVTFTLKENGNFDVKIRALYDSGLYVRPVLDGSDRQLNTGGTNLASAYTDQFLTAQNGYYYYNNVSGSTDANTRFLTLEFYIKESGGCNGVYLGAVGISLPNPNTYDIANPALPVNDPSNVYGCKAVLNYVPTGMQDDEKADFLKVKKQYIYECYNDVIKYSEKKELANTINSKLKKLQNIYAGYSGSTSGSGAGICETSIAPPNKPLTKTKSYTSSGGNWIMTCTETYNANGDTAKLVKAGNGFAYQTNFTVTKKCDIDYIGPVVQWLPKCEYSCFHRCYWNNKSGVKDGWDGGPNDDFDQCVSECDGGSYTQSCINSCYSSVYKNNRDVSFVDKFGLANSTQDRTISRLSSNCITDHGNNGTSASNECGQTYCVSDYCKQNGWCENYKTVTNSPCTDQDPNLRYNGLINGIKSDLNSLANIQQANVSIGNFTYKITDSYLKTEVGNEYVFTVNSTQNPKLYVDDNYGGDTSCGANSSVKIGSKGDEAYYRSSCNKTANVTVNLPLSYVDKVTSTSVYKTSANTTSRDAYSVNHLKNKLDSVTDFIASKYYHDSGERKYYTNVFSDSIYVVTKDDKIELVPEPAVKDKNIIVTNTNVGLSGFSSTIKCYYGVYNIIYSECDKNDLDCPCDPDTEICDGGIQYIYRPIDLTNIFPGDVNGGEGRNPRWNWTGTVSDGKSTGAALTAKESLYSANQTVDPAKLIQDIESKGETIYDVSKDSSEIDYEFVLTRENIRNIRKYNASVRDYNKDCVGNKNESCRNYLDYNMSCYKDGNNKQICTSRFMDNIDGNTGSEASGEFITYTNHRTRDMRKSIAGCNNAINGNECDYFGS